MPPVDVDAAVIANARLSRDYSVLSLAAPEVGARTQPGQFVMVKPAVCRSAAAATLLGILGAARRSGEITGVSILNKRAGRSTKKLYDSKPVTWCRASDRSVSRSRRCGADGGRDGGGRRRVAPFATLAATLAAANTPTTLVYGGRTGDELPPWAASSAGHQWCRPPKTAAVAADRPCTPLEAPLKRGAGRHGLWVRARADARRGRQARSPLQPAPQGSAERVMGCGLGGCHSCVVRSRRRRRRQFVRSCIRARCSTARNGMGGMTPDLSVEIGAPAEEPVHRRLGLLWLRRRVREVLDLSGLGGIVSKGLY